LAFEKPPEFFNELSGAERFAADSPLAAAIGKGLAHPSGAMSIKQVTVNTYPSSHNVSCK
jgi:hypothetical protein